LLVDLDVHPRVIMRILRHADQAVTMEIYANASPAATEEAPRRLGETCTEIGCCTLLLYLQLEDASRDLNVTLTRHFTVGVTGFEPATSSSRTKRATKLRHTPYRTEPGRV
jgi:hypothetical protein